MLLTAFRKLKGHKEHHRTAEGKYIKSAVYGGLDGIVTTFAVVAGVAGAALNPTIALILGFSNLIADGISMSVGDYSSAKAEREYWKTERKREEWEVKNIPKEEKQELVEKYVNEGIGKKDAMKIANIFSKYKKAWVNTLMKEELGIIEEGHSPVKDAIVTFGSFVFFGFIPLIAYLLAYTNPYFAANTFETSIYLTAFSMFFLGAAKYKITGQNWMKSGLEMVIIGGATAVAAYYIGYYVSLIV